MNIGISNKTTIKLFSRKFCHSSIFKQNVKNFSTRYVVGSCDKNKYHSSQLLLSDKHSNRTLFYGSTSAVYNLQKRNISNETVVASDIDKTLKSSTPDAAIALEESAQIINSNLPDFVKDISEWKIVDFAQQSLLKVHEISGLPWWASIILTALAARTVITLPFSIMMMHNTAKLQMVQTEMNDIVKQLKKEANYACTYHGWSESLARQHYNKAVRREYKNLIIRDNCHPAKSYIVLLMQLPLWFSYSFATRNLCYMLPEPNINAQLTYMELMVGGFGWVKNLTAADQYFILPVSIALTNLAIMEVHGLLTPTQFTRFEKLRKIIFRSISILMIPIAASVPVALNLYWLSSSLFGFVQAFVLISPRFRRFFKVPITKNDLEHPYRHFYSQLKSKFT